MQSIRLRAAWVTSALALCSQPARAIEWLPVPPEDLAMTSEAKAPQAPAIILYREVDRDDRSGHEIDYLRIKILTEAGRKYANIEIPYVDINDHIRFIEARTIHRDGSIVPFDGTIYDKTIAKFREASYVAKTFALPDVHVGDIIEYRYRHDLASGYVFNSHWVLSDELFTRLGRFSLYQYERLPVMYSWPQGLPEGTAPPKESRGRVFLETHDVPGFISEPYMPPESTLKYRVDFIYNNGMRTEDAEQFWKDYGKIRYRQVEGFIDARHAMEQAVAQIVQPGDAPGEKLRKLYARSQQIRNLAYEQLDDDQRADELKKIRDVGDVWRLGYGDEEQITWLFLALARAAGFEADAVMAPLRDTIILDRRISNSSQLNSAVVRVRENGGEQFFDPGTLYAPFGVLPWEKTMILGLCLDKNGGSWITTTQLSPSDARVVRKARFQLSDGKLSGKLTVTYIGQEAMWRRNAERHEDAAEKRRFLETDVRSSIPVGVDVSLVREPDWDNAQSDLEAEFDLQIPGWAVGAGSRQLLPASLFIDDQPRAFEHATRVHPVYFHFPFEEDDEVEIILPPGLRVNSLPKARGDDRKYLMYKCVTEISGQSLHLTRHLEVNLTYVRTNSYDSLRDFFQIVKAGDEDQIILSAIGGSQNH